MANSDKERCMEKEYFSGKMLNQERLMKDTKDNINMERSKERENLHSHQEMCIMENGSMVEDKEEELFLIKMVQLFLMEYGIREN